MPPGYYLVVAQNSQLYPITEMKTVLPSEEFPLGWTHSRLASAFAFELQIHTALRASL